MRIAAFSINPLYADRVMGGAPKHLQSIVTYLGEQGHEVRVICTRADAEQQPFHWHPNVKVLPVLPFKMPFPQPYAVQAYDLANILHDVGELLTWAERFYMHDGEFLFPYAYADIPTVVSLRDNVYPETIHGGFLFQGHRLILISEYSRRFYAATVGRAFPEFSSRVQLIPNGLDWQRFQYTAPDTIFAHLPASVRAHAQAGQPIVLHPHRPEPSKGIMQTLAAVDLLVHEHGLTKLLTLIPRWLENQATPELRAFYAEVEAEVARRGLADHIVLHGWIPQDLMPEYYSLGSVTFSLGHFVESFGNAVYESLGCGTPSIAARISTHRTLLPDHLLDKVDFDDARSAAAIAAEIITTGRRTAADTFDYLKQHYNVGRQRAAYTDAILNAQTAPPMRYQHEPLSDSTRWVLAPWCSRSADGRVYHDFRADYSDLGTLTDSLRAKPGGITRAEAGVSTAQWDATYRAGFIVPAYDNAD